jgi:putative PIN family toxin of toxin-antitoxin system
MPPLDRVVVDTNVFVSAVVFPLSTPRQAVDKVLDHGLLLFSESTMDELKEVLARAKFGHYLAREERDLFLAQLGSVAEFVPTIQLVRECRDPRDDKFLEVALNGRADVILTGDNDLLALHPWRNVPILSPKEYLSH